MIILVTMRANIPTANSGVPVYLFFESRIRSCPMWLHLARKMGTWWYRTGYQDPKHTYRIWELGRKLAPMDDVSVTVISRTYSMTFDLWMTSETLNFDW